MAANKRKFTVPTAEDLDEKRQMTRPTTLFNKYKKGGESIQETVDDSSTSTAANSISTKPVRSQTTKSSQGINIDKVIENEHLVSNQYSTGKEGLNAEKNLPVASSSSGTTQPTVGKTFRETFAFLEDTSHYKETVAKIKEKEYVHCYSHEH